MTTEDIIIHIFYHVDSVLSSAKKTAQAKLYPSEVVTIGILFALKGGHFRAFYRWLKRDYNGLFGGLPHRTTVHRQLAAQQDLADELLQTPGLMSVIDSYPIELIFPIREGRSDKQLGEKNKDKGRWSVGIKLCWILNVYGRVVGWTWDTMNCTDQVFLPLIEDFEEDTLILSDLGFRRKAGIPSNLKLCPKGTFNNRMIIETAFSLLTVICNAKKMFHRVQHHLEARLSYLAAMFNTCLSLFHQLHPDEPPYKMSFAEFSL
jgi:hypothetical protein